MNNLNNNQIANLNRSNHNQNKKEKDIFSCLKCQKEKICSSLNEVETFLSKASFAHKILKIHSIFKQ